MKTNKRRRQPIKAPSKLTKGIAGLLLIGYISLLLYWMFWGFGRSTHISGDFRYNLVPLETIRLFAKSASWDNLRAPLINLAGNVAVFVPLGVLLPIVFTKLRLYIRFLLAFVLMISLLELSQGILGAGVADIDDLILNTIGGSIGYMIYSYFASRKAGRNR
ncbi:VanZ family protein [Saccharibacillus sp. JS10]|uniref:VanZ family protein n=1 Tax=Saccharibacillus sp. JS10 TaxID=2950552 RepID=UPI00210DEE74|nr:VanZ family protein [Saccharibacillus sp. JS10]MCQ4087057.1 VanZ family protein [Saccharibacillus sp. JS10]